MIFLPVMASFFMCHTQPTPTLLSRPVRPCLELPLFNTLAACYAHTQVWSELRTSLKWSGQSIFVLQRLTGQNHTVLIANLTLVVFFAPRKLVPFSLPLLTPHLLVHSPLSSQNLQDFSWTYYLTPSVPTSSSQYPFPPIKPWIMFLITQ